MHVLEVMLSSSTVFVPVASSEPFPTLSFIEEPNQPDIRIVNADTFTDRVVWLFPFLTLSLSGNITGWIFRGDTSSQPWIFTSTNVPSFSLWQESAVTPHQIDYDCIHCNTMIQSVQLNDDNNRFVYKQTLATPLVVDAAENYILGITLPSPETNNLNLSFHYDEELTEDRLSYFFNNFADFFTINDITYRDNLHIPLASPLYGKLMIYIQG